LRRGSCFGNAMGYEDLNDHYELRHDPSMAVPAGGLRPAGELCAGGWQVDALLGEDIRAADDGACLQGAEQVGTSCCA